MTLLCSFPTNTCSPVQFSCLPSGSATRRNHNPECGTFPPTDSRSRKLPSQTSAHPRPNSNLSLTLSTEDVFTAHELNQTELTCNESTQLRYAFISHAREHNDLIGCSETRTVSGQSVLNACIRTWLFALEVANSISRTEVQLV